MKKIIIAVTAIGGLAAASFLYHHFGFNQLPCYSILSESQATEATGQIQPYSKWVGDWAPENGLEIPEPFYLHVALDTSGLPTYDIRFLTGRYRSRAITLTKLTQMLGLPSQQGEFIKGQVQIPGQLTFDIMLRYNPETDKMEWIGTAYGNDRVIDKSKVVLIRREQSDLAADSIPFKVKRVKADMRSMATALESYFVDCSSYPAWVFGNDPLAVNKASATRSMPSLRLGVNVGGGIAPITLTTPIAYMTRYFADPFVESSTEPQPTFVYYADTNGWILVSPGPDGDYDIDPELDYRSDIPQPSELIVSKGYDPTNGLMSNGDIFRVKQ